MPRKLKSISLPILPFLDYFSPEWEMVVEDYSEITRNYPRVARRSPQLAAAVVAFSQGAINILMARGQEGLYDAVSQMKFALRLCHYRGDQLIV
jgi:hypothetical protein